MATPKILVLEGMHGIGDNIIQAPVAGQFSEHWGSRGQSRVYLRTPWPQLYRKWGNLKFLPPRHYDHLEHATRNVQHCPGYYFQDEPVKGEVTRVLLGRPDAHKNDTSFYEEFAKIFESTMGEPLPETDFRLEVPDFWQFAGRMKAMAAYDQVGQKRVAVLNIPTLTRSPAFKSRVPDPQVVVDVVRMFKGAGYFVVGIASTGENEWIVGQAGTDVPPGERAYGVDYNLPNAFDCIEELIGFISQADVVITPVSGIQQIAIATRTPCFTIYGGHLANHHIVDERMGLDLYGHLAPDPFCDCHEDSHVCNKRIAPETIQSVTGEFLGRIDGRVRNVVYTVPDFSDGPHLKAKDGWDRPLYGQSPLAKALPNFELLQDLQNRIAKLEAGSGGVTVEPLQVRVGDKVDGGIACPAPAASETLEGWTERNRFEKDGDLWVRTKYREQDHVLVDAVYNKDEYGFEGLCSHLPDISLNFLDIGGAIGSASAKWRKLRRTDDIAIFEANPDNMAILERNLFGLRTVAFHGAVWPWGSGFCFLNAITPGGCESTGGGTIVPDHEFDEWADAIKKGRYAVDVRPIATYKLSEAMAAAGFEFVDVLKIDAEGSEYEIFEQAAEEGGTLGKIGTIIGEYHRDQREFLSLKVDCFPEWELALTGPKSNIGMFCLFNPERWTDGNYQPAGQE